MDQEDRSILTRVAPAADAIIGYGTHPEQVAEVRYGRGGEDHPLLVFIHGGFWRPSIDRTHTGPLCTALTADGMEHRGRRVSAPCPPSRTCSSLTSRRP